MKKQLSLLFACVLCTFSVTAQTAYPSKPVKLMVGAGAGGGTDIIARMLAEKMAESLKGTFIVENKAGAGGNVGADAVAKSNPDGYTVLFGIDTAFTVNPHIYKTMPFKPSDLKPVMVMASSIGSLACEMSRPVMSLVSEAIGSTAWSFLLSSTSWVSWSMT